MVGAERHNSPISMKITRLAPVLQVSELRKAIAYYCDVLGFEEDFAFGEPPSYAGLKRNDAVVHLCSSPGNAARRGLGSMYIFCDEVDLYYQEILAKGAEVTSQLNTQPYGMKDFQIKDPDGNLIGFGRPLED